eukprot:scaffold4570_cov96-Skeletonema_dohrnii-CCMP3373.AAC.5
MSLVPWLSVDVGGVCGRLSANVLFLLLEMKDCKLYAWATSHIAYLVCEKWHMGFGECGLRAFVFGRPLHSSR